MTTRKYQHREMIEEYRDTMYCIELIREYKIIWDNDSWIQKFEERNKAGLEPIVRTWTGEERRMTER